MKIYQTEFFRCSNPLFLIDDEIIITYDRRKEEKMGIYLNPNNANFRETVNDSYIDKTMLIDVTNNVLDKPSQKFVCISRPRRFGKSIAEDMLVAYYSKGADSRELFSNYKIAKTENFENNLNKFNVIKIDLNGMNSTWKSIPDNEEKPGNVFFFITKLICGEFRKEFSDIEFGKNESISSCIQKVFAEKNQTFIIVIDEYDCLVREEVPKEEFQFYLDFLMSLFKNAELKPAISLAYLTGILPVIRDKVQSKLNTFNEFTMVDADDFAEFTGFTTEEVKELCKKHNCNFNECKNWYDGYRLGEFEIYNPLAVIKAVPKSKFKSYWSETSTYQVVSDKINMNFEGIRDDVIKMLGGGKVSVNVERYRNTMTDFSSKDDVFTFLIHLGYLAYDSDQKKCYIPNREIYDEWKNAIEYNADYAQTNKIIKASEELLSETINGNEGLVAKALDEAHIHATTNRSYNNEDGLQCAIYLSYIYALNKYNIIREMPAGKGVADLVYIPVKEKIPALIIELKHNKSTDSALNQIRNKQYFDSLKDYYGEIVFVGINYDEKDKTHKCKIERFLKEE